MMYLHSTVTPEIHYDVDEVLRLSGLCCCQYFRVGDLMANIVRSTKSELVLAGNGWQYTRDRLFDT